MNAFRYPIGSQTAKSAVHWLDPYRFAQRHAFDLFEWFSDREGAEGWDFSLCDLDCRRTLARQARSAGMRFTVHSPWDTEPMSPEGRARLRSSVEFATDVEARLLVVHLPSSQQEMAWVDAMKAPLLWAKQADIVLALENTPATSPADCERIFAALRRQYGSTVPIGLCFDMGHANLCPATRNDYVGFIDALGPEVNVAHVHIHENWGDTDQHLVLFTGPAARDPRGVSMLIERLIRRGYAGGFVLEQWPDPPELLLAAAERLRGLLAQA
jgi:sugar phosphate isomerase/epimerase